MGKDLKGKELGAGISQRKDGLYVARFTDQWGRRTAPIYAKTVREIKKKYREAKYEDEHGLTGSGSSVTLKEWYDMWITTYAPSRIKPSSIAVFKSLIQKHVLPYFGKMKLKDITPMQVQHWMHSRNEEIPVRNESLIALRSMLKDAVILGLILANPAEKIPKITQTKQPIKAITVEQAKLIFEQWRQRDGMEEWEIFCKFLLQSGWRFGEAAALCEPDVDWKNKILHVRHTLHTSHPTTKQPYFTTPKTTDSLRDVPLTNQLADLIIQALELQKKRAEQFPDRWATRKMKEERLIFVSRFGAPLTTSGLSSALNHVVAKINERLPEPEQLPHFSTHSFRKGFASLCYANDVPLKVTQQLMGHGDQTMTLYYIQIEEQTVRDQLENLHNALSI